MQRGMKKWLLFLLLPALLLWACVGQKDDPEPEPEPEPEPVVVPEEPAEGSRFFQRVLALEFTATWCQYCPNMADAIVEAQSARPGRVIELAIHYQDELEAPESAAIVTDYKVSSFPAVVLDWNLSSKFTQQQSARIVSYVDALLEKDIEAPGVALKSVVEEGVMTVTTSMKAVADGTFSLVTALVEDGVTVAFQAGAGNNYTCNSVFRCFIGSGREGVKSPALKAGEEFITAFTMEAPEPAGRMRLVAWVLQEGKALNVASASVNSEIKYTYEEETD